MGKVQLLLRQQVGKGSFNPDWYREELRITAGTRVIFNLAQFGPPFPHRQAWRRKFLSAGVPGYSWEICRDGFETNLEDVGVTYVHIVNPIAGPAS